MLLTEAALFSRKKTDALYCHLISSACCQNRRERAKPKKSGHGAVLLVASHGLNHLPMSDWFITSL